MSRIEVVKQIGKKQQEEFRVLINFVQNGCILHSPSLANKHATLLSERHPSATLLLFEETT